MFSRAIFWVGVVALAGALSWTGAAAQAPLKAPPELKAHPQANLPPLDLPKFQLSRSKDDVRAIYRFAAEHPEVLHYIPCFCGCQRLGHKSNEDCFVTSRAKNGDVTAWNDHGMMCPMCLSIGARAMQLYNAKVPLTRIRADIVKTYDHTGDATPTPEPPKPKTKAKTGG